MKRLIYLFILCFIFSLTSCQSKSMALLHTDSYPKGVVGAIYHVQPYGEEYDKLVGDSEEFRKLCEYDILFTKDKAIDLLKFSEHTYVRMPNDEIMLNVSYYTYLGKGVYDTYKRDCKLIFVRNVYENDDILKALNI